MWWTMGEPSWSGLHWPRGILIGLRPPDGALHSESGATLNTLPAVSISRAHQHSPEVLLCKLPALPGHKEWERRWVWSF